MCNCRNVTVLKGDKGDTGATGATGPQGPEGTFGYNTYVGTMTQSGTSAPVVSILQNTLVDTTPTWTRSGVGDYVLTATSSFPSYATKLWISGMSDDANIGASSIPIINATGGVVGHYKIYASDADRVKMAVFNTAGSQVDLVTLIGTTKIYLPEIRIYP